MKNNQKLILASAAAVAVMAGGLFSTQNTLAAETTSSTSPLSGLIDKLATKFNLNKEEVQAVFDEDRAARQTEMRAEMKATMEERLTQAVKDGDLTQAQKDLITAKMTETETKVTENEAITDEGDRRAAMDQLQADLSKWAADNDIDSRFIHFMGGKGGHHGGPRGGFGGPGMRSEATTSSATTNTSTN